MERLLAQLYNAQFSQIQSTIFILQLIVSIEETKTG